MKSRIPGCYILLLVLFVDHVDAQETGKVIIGDELTLFSEILDEERTIYIYLPESYLVSTFEYPVLYLLDAEWDFHHTTGTVEFLSGAGKIPELIVVGIVNTNRSRDLTPEAPNDSVSQAFWGEIGGAADFRLFIKNELIPFVDSTYRTVEYNLLRGQSFGGLFGIFDLFATDPCFNAYMLTSPSVRWNDNIFFKQMEAKDFEPNDRTKLYIGEAEFDWGDNNGIKAFSDIWNNRLSNTNYFHHKLYHGEGHSSLVFEATLDGLKFIYRNWSPHDSIMNSSQLANLTDHYSRLSDEFNYEIKVPMDQIIRLANNQLRKKNYKTGIKIAKKNVELYPDQPQAYWHLGDAYFLSGMKKESHPYFEEALRKAKALNFSDLTDYETSVNRLTKSEK